MRFVVAWLALALCHAESTSKSVVLGLQAARKGDVSGLKDAIRFGLDVNSVEESSGQSLLMAATLAGQAEVVDLLLSLGADAAIGEMQGYTPPHGAGFQGRASVVPILARHGLDLAHMHKDGYTGLHRALWGSEPRHTETVAAFLDAGVDVNQRSRDGRHPLEITKNPATRALLEARGADTSKGQKRAPKAKTQGKRAPQGGSDEEL